MSILRALTIPLTLALVSVTMAQAWIPLGVGASVQSITTLDDNIYVSSYGFGGGVLRSEDDGATWEQAITGMPSNLVRCVGRVGPVLLASHNTGGIYRSTDQGDNWTPSNAGIPANATYVRKFFQFEGVTLAMFNGEISTGGGIYRSDNNGANWSLGHSGMSSNMTIYHITSHYGVLYAATSVGVYRSVNNALQWQIVGTVNYLTYALQFTGERMVAITTFGIMRSDDFGATWQGPATGIPITPGRGELIAYNGYLYASVGAGLGEAQTYRSADNGVSFATYMTGLSMGDQSNQNQFHATAERLYLGALSDAYWMEGGTVAVEEVKAPSIAIYPTAFGDGFTVDLSDQRAGLTVIILDARGREVARHTNLSASPVRIERGSLAAGRYQCVLNDPSLGTMSPLGQVFAQ